MLEKLHLIVKFEYLWVCLRAELISVLLVYVEFIAVIFVVIIIPILVIKEMISVTIGVFQIGPFNQIIIVIVDLLH